jgi:hypothetical protein
MMCQARLAESAHAICTSSGACLSNQAKHQGRVLPVTPSFRNPKP